MKEYSWGICGRPHLKQGTSGDGTVICIEMEAAGVFGLHSQGWTGSEKVGKGLGSSCFVGVRRAVVNERISLGKLSMKDLNLAMVAPRRRDVNPEVRYPYKISSASAVRPESIQTTVEENSILKRNAEVVAPSLSGRCIYLVGMMGSGKTTVGKILAEALGYSFTDSDKVVEQTVGLSSVAQIFETYSEEFFRDNETKALKDLSSMRCLVVATGGGAVIRPLNWKYMNQGVTVWLDVPLEALARRIAAVGTASRPLLHHESGDAYTAALLRLSSLFEERGEAYANAHARVSLEYIAAKQGDDDVNTITPTAIATEALARINDYLKTRQN